MPVYVKVIIEIILWIWGNKYFREIAEQILRRIAEMNDYEWDDRLIDELFGKKE